MADRIPLIVDSSTQKIKELPANDNLDLTSSSIVGVTNITATGIVSATGGFNIGIQSGGVSIANTITTLNFVGTGNTFVYNSATKTVDVSISGSSGGGEVDITASLFS